MLEDTTSDRPRLLSTAWLLVLAVGFVQMFPLLLLRGMSTDGVTNATIARNLAVGIGDVWHPVYTHTLHHAFHEHPPLAFFLESLVFRVFGDQWWIERFYSVSTAIPTGIILIAIWRRLLAHRPELRAYSWLPIGLWVLMPGWSWIYRNNYLENTLGIFTALAIYASLRAMTISRWWPAWAALSAASIVAAILSKGPVGLFPAVAPAVVWLSLGRDRIWHGAIVQLALLTMLAAILGMLLVHGDAREFLLTYFRQQVAESLQGRRELVGEGLQNVYLLRELLHHLVFPAVAAGGLVLLARGHADASAKLALRGPMLFCWLTAASASLPIMISPKQSAYYAAGSWPFYTMALAMWCLPSLVALGARFSGAKAARANAWLRVGSVAAITLTTVLSPLWYGSALRDRELIADVDRIGQAVKPHENVAIPPELWEQWDLHAYLYREHYISLEAEGSAEFRLQRKDDAAGAPADYAAEDIGLRRYQLYRHARLAESLAEGQLRGR